MVVGICLIFDCGGLSVVASGVYVFVCLHVLYVVALRLCSFGFTGVGWIDVVGRCIVGFAVIWVWSLGLVFVVFGLCVWVVLLGGLVVSFVGGLVMLYCCCAGRWIVYGYSCC